MRKTNSGRSANRREFLKGSALATGAFFINSKFSLKMLDEAPTSPFTVPWLQPLRFPNYAIPLPEWQPLDPIIDPSAHQRFEEFAPTYFYEYEICEAQHRAHPQLGFSTLSTFCDSYPAPTFMMRYGQPAFVRMKNHLPPTVQGFGHCDVITHVHNGHHPSESDGYPGDHFSPGMFRDYHYPNIYAGGDPLEAKSTLWYHDHCLDFTSQNVYRGLAGFFLLFDDKDSGNESDPNPDALRLPSGVPDGKRVKHRYDIPLILFDPRFDSQGKQVMNIMDMDGHLGDKYTVNGLVQPYFEVERRKYRFRILDGGPSRFYELWFSNSMEFQHIGNDGNLLPAPVTANHVKLAVAERADIVVDFSTLPSTTTEIFLVNRAEQIDGRGPTGNLLPMATAPKLLKLVIRPKSGSVPDQSQVPAVLKPNPAMDMPVVATRSWHFDRTNGMWSINGKLADLSAPSAVVKQNTAEIWHLSTSGGWAHPVHMHMEEYRILTRNGQSVAGTVLGGRKDVFPLYAGDEMTIYMKFRDWVGRYVMHCHNTVHEDHSMMLRWDVVP